MMVVLSVYTIVDGIFIAKYVGSDALASINIINPVYSVILAVGVMLGTGGSAVIAKKMGENNMQKACSNFSFIVLSGFLISLLIAAVGTVFLDDLIYLLGASDILFPYCRDYLEIILIFSPAFILQVMFQTLFVTAGRPKLGLCLIIGAGVLNIVLDYVFIVTMDMGVTGAALGTSIGFLLPAVAGVAFFLTKWNHLHFVKPQADFNALLKSCTNGSSEMVGNLATAVMILIFNYQMMRFAGEDGVAAISAIMYAQFIFTAVYFGFSQGVAPVLSYNYGCGNKERLSRVFRMSMAVTVVMSAAIFLLSMGAAQTVTEIFLASGTNAHDMAVSGFHIFALSFLFLGTNIFASAFFTAMSNGKISAFISFIRTFVFIMAGLLILPEVLGMTGIWLAVPLGEILTVCVSAYLLTTNKYLLKTKKKETCGSGC